MAIALFCVMHCGISGDQIKETYKVSVTSGGVIEHNSLG